jgi:flavin reductase (DIM6/NTAB) family NADH-FMN oxidoreductase RutF
MTQEPAPIFIKSNTLRYVMEKIPAKDAFSKIKPEWIVFVISVDKNKKPNGLVAARFMKCSRNPPLVAVSIDKKSNTHHLIKTSKEFVVAIANQDLLPHVEVFGRESGMDVDKFEKTKIKTIPAKHIETPLLKEATINFECKLESELSVGSSTLFLGKVIATHINKDKKILFNYGRGYGEYIFKELGAGSE